MANDDSSGEVRDLGQRESAFQTLPDEIRKRIQWLNRKIRTRRVVASAAGFLVIAGSLWYLVLFRTLLERIGCLLTVLGAAYLIYEIYVNQQQIKAASASAEKMGTANSIEFYRAELVRQRDFHSGIWFWSRLLIFTPGPLIFTVGFAIAHPARAGISHIDAIAFLVLIVLAIPLNLRVARRYQCQIDQLDRIRKLRD
jgi:hypothetical protein